MTYKSVYDLLGGYTAAARTNRCEDVDLWFRFFHAGLSGGNINEPLYIYTIPMHKETVENNLGKCRTRVIGYKMLRYPFHAYVALFLNTLIRVICPETVLRVYRRIRYGRGKRIV